MLDEQATGDPLSLVIFLVIWTAVGGIAYFTMAKTVAQRTKKRNVVLGGPAVWVYWGWKRVHETWND